MNTPPTNRDEQIFWAAVALPAAERAAYLDAECGEDHALRARVGRLLASHEASGFMAAPAGPFAEIPGPLSAEIEEQFERLKPEEAGERIGNFKLVEQIGEGGFGTVWLAEQEQPVRRQVALKIIKLGMDTREVIARFEQERQALAVMDHPNIARVFDAGATQFGRPYFVMEMVRGTRITDYCDEAKLSTAERLRLFIAVCQAVQHAHQKGIIHRDLKPSNILVAQQDGAAVPKVIDFGVAKAMHGRLSEAAITTNLEQMIGTPLYMSPEQAEMNGGDVDTRSDIYSLGVLLYELLTGRTPFTREDMAKAGYAEMRRLICESEPRKPSTALETMGANLRSTVAQRRHCEPSKLMRLINGDLDWIVMKAIEKDRSRRYANTTDLAADIERHLRNEPISARSPGTAYLLGKLIRRHKVAFAAGTAVALVLVLGIVGTTWGLMRERKAKEEVQTAAAINKTVNEFITHDLFGSADPDQEPDRNLRVRTILDRAAGNIGQRFKDQPLIEAAIRMTLSSTYGSLGEYKVALKQAERAFEIRSAVLGAEHIETLVGRRARGTALYDARKDSEAEADFRAVFERQQEIFGSEHRETLLTRMNLANTQRSRDKLPGAEAELREIVATSTRVFGPEDLFTQRARFNLAVVLYSRFKYAEAEAEYRAVSAFMERHFGAAHPETMAAQNSVANVMVAQGRHQEAEVIHRAVVGVRQRVLGAEHPDTLVSRGVWADSLKWMGRYTEAETELRLLSGIRGRILGQEDLITLTTRTKLADCLNHAGKSAEAAEEFQKLIEAMERHFGPEHTETLRCRSGLGSSLRNLGKPAEAEAIHRAVLAIQERTLGAEHKNTMMSRNNLALTLDDQGKTAEAEAEYKDLLKLQTRVLGAENPDTLWTRNNLAISLDDRGESAEAEAEHRAVLEIRIRVLGPENPATLASRMNLGKALQALKKYEEAEAEKMEVLRIQTRVLGPENPDTLLTRINLTNSMVSRGKFLEAEAEYRAVINIATRIRGAEHSLTLRSRNGLAQSLIGQRKFMEAEKEVRDIYAIHERRRGIDHPETLSAQYNLALALEGQNKIDEATQSIESVLTNGRQSLGNRNPVMVAAARLLNELNDRAGSRPLTKPAPPMPAPAVRDAKKLEAALELARKNAPDHADTIAAMLELAAAYGAEGSGRKGIKLGEEALALARRTLPTGDERIIAAMKVLVPLYKSVDLDDEARKLEEEIRTQNAKKPQSKPIDRDRQ